MHFSINAPSTTASRSSITFGINERVAHQRFAFEYGFDHLGVGHHWISHPNVFLEPWSHMAYLSGQLPGTMVSGFVSLPLYSAVDMAEKVATMDQLSRGTFALKGGVGWREEEFLAAGVNMRTRGSRLEEMIAVCKLLWSGEEVTYSGKHFQLTGARMAYQPLQLPHPPIWIAAQSEQAVRRAARIGDAPWIPFQVGYPDVKRLMESYREELTNCGKAYPRTIPIMRFISVDDDPKVAQERARTLENWFQWYAASEHFTRVKVNYTFEEELRDRTIAGTPEQVTAGLLKLHQEFGFNVFDLHVLWPSTDTSTEILRHVAYIGEKVVAPLRAAERISIG
jgi:alkanesulfonate monooxygenase SsuD/methylene tetrahydromethanopterin reductase-like flavin-dependent oxidoreductase (luciferase family)